MAQPSGQQLTYDTDTSWKLSIPPEFTIDEVAHNLDQIERGIVNAIRRNHPVIKPANLMRFLALAQAPSISLNPDIQDEFPETYALAYETSDPSIYVHMRESFGWLMPHLANEPEGREFTVNEVFVRAFGRMGLRYDPNKYAASDRTHRNRNHPARYEYRAYAADEYEPGFGFVLMKGEETFVKTSCTASGIRQLEEHMTNFRNKEMVARRIIYSSCLEHRIVKVASWEKLVRWHEQRVNRQRIPHTLVSIEATALRMSRSMETLKGILETEGRIKRTTGQYQDVTNWQLWGSVILNCIKELSELTQYLTPDDFDINHMIIYWATKETHDMLLRITNESDRKIIEDYINREKEDLSNILKGLFD